MFDLQVNFCHLPNLQKCILIRIMFLFPNTTNMVAAIFPAAVRPTHLVLCHGVLHSLSGGLDRSWVQNQLVQPGQQTLQPLLDADRLGHRRLQLLGALRHRRRQRVEPSLQAV